MHEVGSGGGGFLGGGFWQQLLTITTKSDSAEFTTALILPLFQFRVEVDALFNQNLLQCTEVTLLSLLL